MGTRLKPHQSYQLTRGVDTQPCPIAWQAEFNPDLSGIILPDGSALTYRELHKRILDYRPHEAHQKENHEKEHVVWLQQWNSAELVVRLFAALRSAKLALLMSPSIPREPASEIAERVKQGLRGEFGPGASDSTISASAGTLMLTSGTTGAPKIAKHSTLNHLESAILVNQALKMDTADRWLWSLPAFHIGGLAIIWRCMLAGAALQVLPKGRTLQEQFLIAPPSILSLVPTQLHDLVESETGCPTGLRDVIVGGAPLSSDLLARALELGYPLRTTYGMTESSSMISLSQRWTLPSGPVVSSHVHAGRLLPGVESRHDEDGRFWIRGATVFGGYVHQAAGDDREGTSPNAWYRTGDIVRIDDLARLVVGSRMDDIIISGGENIDLQEVAKALLDLEQVEQAVIVPLSDARFGQRPVAFVKMKDSAKLPQHDWFAHLLAAAVPKHFIPDHFFDLTASFSGASIPSKVELSAYAERKIATLRGPLP